MAGCLPCVSAPAVQDSDEWTSDVIQDLYSQCLSANRERLIVYGLFARANAVNTNNRLYPKRILTREVKKFVKDQVSVGCALGEMDHPSYSSPNFKHLNLPNLSHQVLSVKWKGNALWGFIEVLDTPSGRLIRSLYERGCKLGVSSRGWASLRDLPGKSYKCIMNNFELITFDFVTEPSTKGAWLLPYAGCYRNAVPRQAVAEAVSRLGVGAVPPEQLATLPPVADMQAGFSEFSRRLQHQQRFPVKRMTGPHHWRVSTPPKASSRGVTRKRTEPAATDTTCPHVRNMICRGMADGLPHGPPLQPFAAASDTMKIPMSNSIVLTYPTPQRPDAPVHYGSYVVLAPNFGVPSQHGLRDYWRHAYLFRERALLSLFPPSPSIHIASRAPVEARIVFTSGLGLQSNGGSSASDLSGALDSTAATGSGAPVAGAPLREQSSKTHQTVTPSAPELFAS